MNNEFKKIVLQEDIAYLIDCLNRTLNEKNYQINDDHLILLKKNKESKKRDIRKLRSE